MFWLILLFYIVIFGLAYIVMNYLYKQHKLEVLRAPNKTWLYYVLQFTWGLLANVFGAIVALYCLITRKTHFQYRGNLYFELKGNAGFSLGMFCFVPANCSNSLKNHEFGHSIQNIYFGPGYFVMVGIPSAARFLWREIQRKRHKPLTTQYDDIWFEGQATKIGKI